MKGGYTKVMNIVIIVVILFILGGCGISQERFTTMSLECESTRITDFYLTQGMIACEYEGRPYAAFAGAPGTSPAQIMSSALEGTIIGGSVIGTGIVAGKAIDKNLKHPPGP